MLFEIRVFLLDFRTDRATGFGRFLDQSLKLLDSVFHAFGSLLQTFQLLRRALLGHFLAFLLPGFYAWRRAKILARGHSSRRASALSLSLPLTLGLSLALRLLHSLLLYGLNLFSRRRAA